MAARNHMVHRASVQRSTRATDDLGLPGIPTWSSQYVSLPCRWWAPTGMGRYEIMDGEKVLISNDQRMLVPLDADVIEADQVTAIKDRKGTSLVSNTMQIRAVIRRRDHKEVRLVELH